MSQCNIAQCTYETTCCRALFVATRRVSPAMWLSAGFRSEIAVCRTCALRVGPIFSYLSSLGKFEKVISNRTTHCYRYRSWLLRGRPTDRLIDRTAANSRDKWANLLELK